MEDDLYDEFGNYVGPDINQAGDDSEEDGSERDVRSK